MKRINRVLATLLMLVMLMQPFATAASVTDFLDFPNNWSTEAMTAAVENGLLIGNGNKLIEPNRNLKRSELAAIITRAFGATITADIGHFDDVKPGDWYYNAVSKAMQMGSMNGTSSSTFHPEKSITREEVFTVLARVLCIEGTDEAVLDRFSDNGAISDWARASIIGLVENGYIDGYPNGTLGPKNNMTRAELAQMFHNLFKTYIDTSGYHTSVASEGSVIVRAPGAHLENVVINGDLIIADGVGSGDFDLNTVTVKGRILARGGEGTVTFKKVTATDNVVIFDRNGVVNFHNYRTDIPFKDNLIEYTPATFLKKQQVTTGTGTSSRPSGETTRYTVRFYYNYDFDGDGQNNDVLSTQSVRSGSYASKPMNDPKRDGYIFKYWSDDMNDDGTGTGFDFINKAITAETNLYAIYVKEHKITIYRPDGTFYDVKIEDGEKLEKPAAPEKEGYVFKYWSEDENDDGKGTGFDFDTPITGDTTLYPIFVKLHNITFDLGEGVTKVVTVEDGTKINEADVPSLEDTATEKFKGWKKEDGTLIAQDAVKDYVFTEDTVLTPWFTNLKIVNFYNGDNLYLTVQVDGDYVAKPDEDPTKGEGSTFLYWGTSQDAETGFNFDETPITDGQIIYAVYQYTVTFDVDGTEYTTQQILHGKNASAPTTNPDAPTADVHFVYWSLEKNGSEYKFDENAVTEPITLYAVFAETEYTVTFMANGTEYATETVLYGGTASAPGTNPTAPAGQRFSHWSLADGGAEFDFTTEKIYADTVLYAVFVPLTSEKFDVIFKVDGTEVHSEEVTDGGYAAGPENAPEDKDDKYFVGWIVEGDATETVVDLTKYAITEDTVFESLFKDKLAVKFYDRSRFGDPLVFTAYVKPGEKLADNQYPHHEENLGESVLDYGVDGEGFERNPGINSVYDGVDYVHKIPLSYWYVANEGDKEWTAFDSTVEINESTDVYINVKQVSLEIDAPQISEDFSLVLWANYNDEARAIDTFKDILFINEKTVIDGYSEAESKFMGKLKDKILVFDENDENPVYYIKNINKPITLVQILGKDNINEYIWEFVGDNASDEDVEKDKQKKAYVNQLVDELCAGEQVTVTEDRLFMFEPILEKLEAYDYEFVESKVPEQLKQVLPMEKIEELFTRFYDDATHGYVAQMRAAMEAVTGNPDKVEKIGSGVTIMINPISDLFTPALVHAVSMKGLADGKLAEKFPTYYEYYKDNTYAKALEEYLTTDTWFNGSDAGFEGELSGYSLKEFEEYYEVIKALAVLSDDAILYYYNEVSEADRDEVLDVALTKLLDIANILNGILVDYEANGIPDNLEDFIKSIEKDPELVEYLEKYGVGAYLDKISGNENADKVYDTVFDKVMDKFGTRIEALLTKYAESKLNRYYDEEEYNKALEALRGLFTTAEDEAIYTVDTIFDDYLDGVDYKEISKKDITVSAARKYLTDISLVE